GLADAPRARPDDRQRLAAIRLNLASLRQASDPQAAADTCREAIAIHESLTARFPDVPEYRAALGHCCYVLARALVVAGAPADARRSAERAIELHRPAPAAPLNDDGLRALGDDHLVLAHILVRL